MKQSRRGCDWRLGKTYGDQMKGLNIKRTLHVLAIDMFLFLMRKMGFLHDCVVCSIRSLLLGSLSLLLVFSPLIEHNTEQHMCPGLTGCEMSHWAVCQPLPWRRGKAWRLSLLVAQFGMLPSLSPGINLSQQGLTDSSPDTCSPPPPLPPWSLLVLCTLCSCPPNMRTPPLGHCHRSELPRGPSHLPGCCDVVATKA